MVLYDPKRSWIHQGTCRKLDADDLFFASGGYPSRPAQKAVQDLWAEAKEVCSYCPVLAECRRDTLGEEYGVWGGLDQHQRFLIRKRLSSDERWKKWPEEKILEWGEHLAKLRSRGVMYSEIQRQTGLLPKAVEGLIAAWREHEPAPEPVAEVIELPAPVEAPRKRQAWPQEHGRRHAWVRNHGVITDGWYAGQTEDGKWICMQIWSGRGNVFKWFKPVDVRFYIPQTRWTVAYPGRPDANDVQEDAHAA
ncbi:WhiB family transcriptional regulator [Streptomyces sp. NPDC058664]|uniref:WhiB family transcriptional regulator n=1 Tax=unclassified Streptomyces TaxID=2593676 RepID=UPI0036583EB2